jgi:hypothetical protein
MKMKTLTPMFLLVLACIGSQSANAATAGEVCRVIAGYSPSSASACVEIASKASFQDSAMDVCKKIANSSGQRAVECMSATANNYYEAVATDTALIIAGYSPSSAVDAMKVSANKQYLNDAALVCKDIANSSGQRAVECLGKAGVPYDGGRCPSGRDIKASVDAALDHLYNGSARQAVRVLEGLSLNLESCR